MPAQPRTLILPEIRPLQQQLKNLYEMNGLKPSEQHLYREAWGIKQATGFIKRKGRREEIPRETWLNQVAQTKRSLGRICLICF